MIFGFAVIFATPTERSFFTFPLQSQRSELFAESRRLPSAISMCKIEERFRAYFFLNQLVVYTILQRDVTD